MSDLAAPTTSDGKSPSASSRLFEELNGRGIRYCHFKSNLHLGRALAGETDLDLFVHPADKQAFTEIVGSAGFKRARSHWPLDVPEVEHFFGLDAATGALLHPHVYYELLVGSRSVKDHRLDLTEWLFEGSRLLDGVRVPSTETELVLLYIRANLKVDAVGALRALIKRSPVYAKGELEEVRWLARHANAEVITRRVTATGLRLDPAAVTEFLAHVESGSLPPAFAWSHRTRVRKALRDRRRGGGSSSLLVRARLSRPVRKLTSLPKKTLPGPGLVVAIVGADGSGKTTLARDLARWLGWKFDVRHLYFGIPKNSLTVWTLRKARGLARRVGARSSLIDRRLWLHVARRRLALHRDALDAAKAGAIVIAERYPMRELWEMSEPMDGPRIPAGGNDHARERALYDAIAEPDLLLVLDADLETLRRRESGLRPEIHAEKVRVVGSLVGHPKAQVIDVQRPYDEVLLEAKRAVWQRL